MKPRDVGLAIADAFKEAAQDVTLESLDRPGGHEALNNIEIRATLIAMRPLVREGHAPAVVDYLARNIDCCGQAMMIRVYAEALHDEGALDEAHRLLTRITALRVRRAGRGTKPCNRVWVEAALAIFDIHQAFLRTVGADRLLFEVVENLKKFRAGLGQRVMSFPAEFHGDESIWRVFESVADFAEDSDTRGRHFHDWVLGSYREFARNFFEFTRSHVETMFTVANFEAACRNGFDNDVSGFRALCLGAFWHGRGAVASVAGLASEAGDDAWRRIRPCYALSEVFQDLGAEFGAANSSDWTVAGADFGP